MMSVAYFDWRTSAACRDLPFDLFFPDGDPDDPAVAAQTESAKQVCHTCPVSRRCLEWATKTFEPWSVAGGTTPHERRLTRRRANAARRRAA